MTPAARFLAVGGLCGLTWAASFRGWMVELARGSSTSSVTWLTFALLLLPGLTVGVLLGWSAYLRSIKVTGTRWLTLTPGLFASALLDPKIFSALIRNGDGGGSLIVVATALCSGFVLSRRGWSIARAGCTLVAAVGLVLLFFMGTLAAPLSTARGAWVCLYGLTLVALLCLASVLPYPPVRPPRGSVSWVALGALCGLAWACALRSFMTAVAGTDSAVHWGMTFGYILLPGAVIGALLGWAEFLRRTGAGQSRHRLAYAPLLFGSVLLPGLLHPGSFLADGIGGGALGVPLIAMFGGFAISGRGPAWERGLAGLLFTAGLVVWLVTAVSVGGESFALDTAHGLWVSVLFESLLVTFAIAASAPHGARSPKVRLSAACGTRSGQGGLHYPTPVACIRFGSAQYSPHLLVSWAWELSFTSVESLERELSKLGGRAAAHHELGEHGCDHHLVVLADVDGGEGAQRLVPHVAQLRLEEAQPVVRAVGQVGDE